MDQNLNNSPNDFLWSLLENPANDASTHVYNLNRLVNDFPQSGILQALLAHASEEKNLKRASVYFSPRALFKLINAPSTFSGVPDERIVVQAGISVNGSYRKAEPSVFEENYSAYTAEDLVVDKSAPPAEAEEEQVSHHAGDELIVDHNAEEYLSHVTEEEHGAQSLTEEASTPGTGPQTEEEIAAVDEPAHGEIESPVEEEAATDHTAIPERIVHHGEDEVVAVHDTAPKEEEIEPHGDYQVIVAHEAAAEATELPLAEQTMEEIAGEEVIHGQSSAYLPVPEAAQDAAHEGREEELLPEPGAMQAEGEEQREIPEETTERAAEELEETELPEQSIGLDADKDEPVPVIDLDEEKPSEMPSEITIEEDIRPQTAGDDADEIYDEIVGIEDINLGPQNKGQFFSFDQEFGAHEDREEKEHAPAPVASAEGEPEQQDISKYHDEKMPYTFMWWLDKTRKEHAQIYQPYIKPPAASKKAKKITDELQQQYFENIFHITSVDELDKSTPPAPASPDLKRKDQLIIERFIKEEPQIKPQSSDRIDNENKAKKSSEDRDELVSETLAGIYTDQMLYHKAIASYKKLMLKFPEKSRYFAEKIEQLEKKTN